MSEKGPRRMTPADERRMLLGHGTEAAALSPGAILSAAEADMRWKRENALNRTTRSLRKSEGLPTGDIPNARKYTFRAEHVAKAETPAGLLALALAGRDDGVASSHVATAYVYRACHMRGGGR